MKIDLRRAKTFVTVADLGTVTKAASRLHVAQPALSRQIATLEEELGFKLFDRVARRLVLTGAGEELLIDCRRLLSQAEALDERAQLLRQGGTGTLRVSASPQFIEGVLARFLHVYAQRFPKVQVKLIETAYWAETLALLERGEIHVGQNMLRAIPPGDTRFASLRMETVEFLAAFKPPIRVGKGNEVEISRLAGYPLLLAETGLASRRAFDAACRAAGVEPNVVFESRTPHTLLAMAEQGHGVAVVPSAVQINRYSLCVARVAHEGKALREPLGLFWDQRRSLPSYGAEFCSMLTTFVRDAFPISKPSTTRRSR